MGLPEDGSVVTWRRVPKSLMALERRFCLCVPKSLMCSPDVGSVVTWGRSVTERRFCPRLRRNLRAVLFLFFLRVTRICVCGLSQVPREALRTVVIATRLLVGVLTLSLSITWRRFVRLEFQRQVGRCPQCPRCVVVATVARRHVVTHRVGNAGAVCGGVVLVNLVHVRVDEQK